MGHHQAKLEQSLGILNMRTMWDPIWFTLLITLNIINKLRFKIERNQQSNIKINNIK